MGKYDPLRDYLLAQTGSEVELSFAQIEALIGEPLPPSSLSDAFAWSNSFSHSKGSAWLSAGWIAEPPDLPGRTVVFRRATDDEIEKYRPDSRPRPRGEVLVVRAGPDAVLASEFRARGLVAVAWSRLSDLSKVRDRDELRSMIDAAYGYTPGHATSDLSQLGDFLFDLAPGEPVISYDQKARQFMIGEVKGGYHYDAASDLRGSDEPYRHTFSVEWQGFASRDAVSDQTRKSFSNRYTTFWLDRQALDDMRLAAGISERCLRRYWVEKTYVTGRPDRDPLQGHGLGRALWSPKVAVNGADVYREMREAKPGDVVLHFIDNKQFAGVSVVAGPRSEFRGAGEDNDWHGRECWRLPLRDFEWIDPAITREAFFAPQNLPLLQAVLDAGMKVFYNKKFELNQGHYLTELPTEVVSMLDALHLESTGKHLPHVDVASAPSAEAVHLLMKWSSTYEPKTIELHQEVERSHGSVWWGNHGSGRTAMSAKNVEKIQGQLDSGVDTWVFLWGGGQLWRARLHELTTDPARADKGRVPSYYTEPDNLMLRISGFERLDPEWAVQHLVLASNRDPARIRGALQNQTTPMLVIQTDGGVPGRQNQVLTMSWLAEKTLWPESELKEVIDALVDGGQVVLAGPPGTGKTWVAEHIARYLTQDVPQATRLVQFHPSYGYEEFIEGLRPVADDGRVDFRVVQGVVPEMVRQLEASKSQAPGRSVLVIDEMNRANLPRVFGELMYLFEYRDRPIDLQYSRGFSLPKELLFVGTMNTADRSIRSIDVALRRRFEVFECFPSTTILSRYYAQIGRLEVPDLLEGLERLNTELATHLDRHHTVGQTFFMAPVFDAARLRRVWTRKIGPLIEEYFFDQPDLAAQFTAERFWESLA